MEEWRWLECPTHIKHLMTESTVYFFSITVRSFLSIGRITNAYPGTHGILGKRGYPVTHIKRKTCPLHRVLLDFPYGNDVDHISGDKLDNRRANLRVCTHRENMRNQKMRNTNTSGYMGVSYLRCAGKYEAYVHCDGKKHYLGLFASPREAALARDRAARTLFGQYARLNLPQEGG